MNMISKHLANLNVASLASVASVLIFSFGNISFLNMILSLLNFEDINTYISVVIYLLICTPIYVKFICFSAKSKDKFPIMLAVGVNIIYILPTFFSMSLQIVLKYLVFVFPFTVIGILVIFDKEFKIEILNAIYKLRYLFLFCSILYMFYLYFIAENIHSKLPGFSYGDVAWFILPPLFIYLLIYFFCEISKFSRKLNHLVIVSILVVTLSFTGLRTGWLCVAVTLFFLFIIMIFNSNFRKAEYAKRFISLSFAIILAFVFGIIISPATARVNAFKNNLFYEFTKHLPGNTNEINLSTTISIQQKSSNSQSSIISNEKSLPSTYKNIDTTTNTFNVNSNSENSNTILSNNIPVLTADIYNSSESEKSEKFEELNNSRISQIESELDEGKLNINRLGTTKIYDMKKNQYRLIEDLFIDYYIKWEYSKNKTDEILRTDISENNREYILVAPSHRNILSSYSIYHDRVNLWKLAGYEFKESPFFGNGIMFFQKKYNYTYPHNIILESLTDLGILGTVFFILILSYIYLRIFSHLLRTKNKEYFIIVGFISSFVPTFLFYTSLYNNKFLAFFIVVLISIYYNLQNSS